jgi:hypothetical protein
MAKTKEDIAAQKEIDRIKTAQENYDKAVSNKKRDWIIPTIRIAQDGPRQYDSNDWRPLRGEKKQWQGITIFAPVDPYTTQMRKDFRSANANPYVFRCNRIMTSFVCGHGWTTSIVPRNEEEIPKEQILAYSQQSINVPYWNNEPRTMEQIKDWVDKLVKDKLQLGTNYFNGYYVALEQGRCVLAITPLAKKDGKWQMPEMLRLIRAEYTQRPILDQATGDLKGCYIVGVETDEKNSSLPAERMMYIMHGFNNELFSDFFGDSKVARVADIANTLNVILNDDYGNGAQSTWWKPGAWTIPIPPQEAGNEESIITTVGNKINEAKGRTIVMSGPSNKDDLPPAFIPGDKTADIAGLDLMRTGIIKGILTAYGIPGFMLSEGDFGSLGGDANIQEIDGYINTEINPERTSSEKVIEDQLYDRILCILFDIEDPAKLPIRMKHKFNKPKLVTMIPPPMYEQLKDMTGIGLIDEDGLRDMLGLTEYDKETMSEGANTDPDRDKWNAEWKSPIQINMWPNQDGSMKTTTSAWGSMPKGWGKTPTHDGKTQQPSNQWTGQLRAKLDKIRQNNYQPTAEDLQDPRLRLEWAKLQEAKKLREAMNDGTS